MRAIYASKVFTKGKNKQQILMSTKNNTENTFLAAMEYIRQKQNQNPIHLEMKAFLNNSWI